MFERKPIYLDYNATTPHDPEAIEAMRPYLETHFGNPSSSHLYGVRAREAVVHAREQVAGLLKCAPEEVVFTGGGTESNNFAIKGIAFARRDRGNHIITTQIEHPAVLEVCRYLEGRGFAVSYLPVDGCGLVDVSEVEKAMTPQTVLVTVMHANNEVGTVQPIAEIAELTRARGVALHTDAAQSVGKIPADVEALGVDLLSVAGHKVYAPKGIGALYIRQGIALETFMHGAGHESGRRAGTENVLEIVGLGQACEVAGRDLQVNMRHMREMRDRLWHGLTARMAEVRSNGHPEARLPNTLSVSFRGVDAEALLGEVRDDVAASAGAACHSGEVSLSAVLTAMKLDADWARGTLRFSTGRMTTPEDIDRAVGVIAEAVDRLRNG